MEIQLQKQASSVTSVSSTTVEGEGKFIHIEESGYTGKGKDNTNMTDVIMIDQDGGGNTSIAPTKGGGKKGKGKAK